MSRLAVAAVLAAALPSLAGAGAPLRSWPAVSGIDTLAVIEMASALPASTEGSEDQPYCDANAAVAQTLAHDFGESLVDARTVGDSRTQLWASDLMGTWTLVLNRANATSCIVASGVGFTTERATADYFAKAGLQA